MPRMLDLATFGREVSSAAASWVFKCSGPWRFVASSAVGTTLWPPSSAASLH